MFQPKGKEIEKDYKKPCNPAEIPQHPPPPTTPGLGSTQP